MKPTVYYIENRPVPEVLEYIVANIPREQFSHEWEGCEFVYFPLHQFDTEKWKSVKDLLFREFPLLTERRFNDVLNIIKSSPGQTATRLLDRFRLSNADASAFLVYTDGTLQQSRQPYKVLSRYRTGKITIQKFFKRASKARWKYLNWEKIESGPVSNLSYSTDYCLDRLLSVEPVTEDTEPAVSTEIIAKLDALKEIGSRTAMLDIVVHILNNLNDNIKGDKNAVLRMIERHWADYAEATEPSRLFIDRHSRIFLPDYGNVEIEMPPLPKTLYLFYLRHPEGVAFSHLSDHHKEFKEIYSRITNRSDPELIDASVSALINPLDNSVNEKCARIKAAFMAKMHLSVAGLYLIEGERGGKKGIKLDRRLVSFEAHFLTHPTNQ